MSTTPDSTPSNAYSGSLGTTEELPELSPRHESQGAGSLLPTGIARNAIIVGAAFIASRILGLVREIVIAARFGTSPDYDAYVAAFRIPDLLFLLVMSGAFGSAFIPVFGGFLARGRHETAWKLASAILSYTLVIMAVAGALTFIFAGTLIDLVVAPGLDPGQAQLAANLTRLLLLSPLLLGIGIAFKGMLEAQERFTLSAYAPVFYNLGIIFGAVALVPPFGIYGLAIGVVIGACLHAGIQWVGLAVRGTRLRLHFDRSTEGLVEVVKLMGPRILGQTAFQVNFIVMTNFASREGSSSVGALNYAYQIFMLPHGVIALSVSTVIFPLMARQVQLGDIEGMKRTLSRALGPLVFLSLPAAVGLYAFREPIVQMLFQFGSFDQESTRLVAGALALFAVGLVGYVVTEAIARAFYALHDTRTPVTVAISAVFLNVALSWILVRTMGYTGLALSLSIASTIEAVILVVILLSRTGALSTGLLRSVVKSVIGTAALSPFAYWAGDRLASITDPSAGRSIGMYAIFIFGLATTIAVYFGVTYILGSDQVRNFGSRVPVLRSIIHERYSR